MSGEALIESPKLYNSGQRMLETKAFAFLKTFRLTTYTDAPAVRVCPALLLDCPLQVLRAVQGTDMAGSAMAKKRKKASREQAEPQSTATKLLSAYSDLRQASRLCCFHSAH